MGQFPKRGNHFSTTAVTCSLKQPTRKETEADRLRPLFRADSLLFGLAPDGVYRARPVTRPAGELLPHRFTLTSRQEPAGGLFSVALSLTLRLVGVTHHRILRSPDFPLARMFLAQKMRLNLERKKCTFHNPNPYLTSDCPAHSDSFKIVARHTTKSKRCLLLWGASD